MIYSNDQNLATLNAEIAVLRAALLAIVEATGAGQFVIANLITPVNVEQLRKDGMPTIHIDALIAAQARMLKALGHPPR